MIHSIYVYESLGTDPYQNIATEKFLLENVGAGECILYLWQNKNTVVIGRNQNAWAECRTALLEEEGGKLARRLSGGGAVFHDMGNLNFTFLMRDEDYDLDRQFDVILHAVRSLGISAEKSGRNDLLAEGFKFSGNAFYHSQGHAYHHGTLLVDADMEKLGRYLTPPKAKLEAKGVKSVRSRVTNLKALCPTLTIDGLKEQLKVAFGKVYGLTPEVLTLKDKDQAAIEISAKELSDWQWCYGPKLPFSVSFDARFDWGCIDIQLQIESGTIAAAYVFSDAMDWALPAKIQTALTGCRFVLKDISTALSGQIDDQQIVWDICQLMEQQS